MTSLTGKVLNNNYLFNHIVSFLDHGIDNVRASRVSVKWLDVALARWDKLKALDLRDLFCVKAPKNYAKSVAVALTKCTRLESVTGPAVRDAVRVFRTMFHLLPETVRELNLLPAYPTNPALLLTSPIEQVTKLALPAVYEDTSQIIDQFPELTHLRVFGEIDLALLIKELNLESLEVMGPFAGKLLRDRQEILDHSVKPCDSLRRLKLVCCAVDEQMIRFLASKLPSLEALEFESCLGSKESSLVNQFKLAAEQDSLKVQFKVTKAAAQKLQEAVEGKAEVRLENVERKKE